MGLFTALPRMSHRQKSQMAACKFGPAPELPPRLAKPKPPTNGPPLPPPPLAPAGAPVPPWAPAAAPATAPPRAPAAAPAPAAPAPPRAPPAPPPSPLARAGLGMYATVGRRSNRFLPTHADLAKSSHPGGFPRLPRVKLPSIPPAVTRETISPLSELLR